MATGVTISGTGASASPQTVDEIKEAIVWIFEAAFDTHMSESVTIEALRLLGNAAECVPGVMNTTISGSTFSDLSDDITNNGVA